MTKAEIYVVLADIFTEVFKRPDISLHPALTAADVPGWDSFRHVDIIMAVDERFNITLETDEIDRINKLGDLVDIVAAKLDASMPNER